VECSKGSQQRSIVNSEFDLFYPPNDRINAVSNRKIIERAICMTCGKLRFYAS
jgi:hypothetical protein